MKYNYKCKHYFLSSNSRTGRRYYRVDELGWESLSQAQRAVVKVEQPYWSLAVFPGPRRGCLSVPNSFLVYRLHRGRCPNRRHRRVCGVTMPFRSMMSAFLQRNVCRHLELTDSPLFVDQPILLFGCWEEGTPEKVISCCLKFLKHKHCLDRLFTYDSSFQPMPGFRQEAWIHRGKKIS